jgi:hypothetical protein
MTLLLLLVACMGETPTPPKSDAEVRPPAASSIEPPPAPAAKMSPEAFMRCEAAGRKTSELDQAHPSGPDRQLVLDAALQAQAACRAHSISGPWADRLVAKLQAEHARGEW